MHSKENDDARSPGCTEMPDAHAFETVMVRELAAVATRDQSDKP